MYNSGVSRKFDYMPKDYVHEEHVLKKQFAKQESQTFSAAAVDPPAFTLRKPVIAAVNGHAIGLGYVRNPDGVDRDWLLAGDYQLEVGGDLVPCSVQLRPLYDPDSQRTKA